MSRTALPAESLTPPQTYDTAQGKRRDSPSLQEQNETGTNRSGPNSPMNQGNIQHPMKMKGIPQGNTWNLLRIIFSVGFLLCNLRGFHDYSRRLN